MDSLELNTVRKLIKSLQASVHHSENAIDL